jgi:diguanylate cyclase (GGDEF)-like protein
MATGGRLRFVLDLLGKLVPVGSRAQRPATSPPSVDAGTHSAPPPLAPCSRCPLLHSEACSECAITRVSNLDAQAVRIDHFLAAAEARGRTAAAADRARLLLLDGDELADASEQFRLHTTDIALLAQAVTSARPTYGRVKAPIERSLLGRDARFAAYAPIAAGQGVLGVLAAGYRRRPAPADPARARLQSYAASLFPALAATVFYKRANDAERDALRLVEAVAALSSALTVDSVAEAACDHARRITGARRARLFLLDGEDLRLACSLPGARHPANRAREARAETMRAWESGEQRTMLHDHEVLFVPLGSEGARRGLLQLDMPAGAARVHPRAVRLTEAVADQAAVAVDRADRSDELHRLAVTDPLTGLANRRRLLIDLAREVARAERFNTALSVAMVDLDRFKRFNDLNGHVAGDRLLREFGGLLAHGCRTTDLAGRYGGEEFLVVLCDTPLEDAEQAVDRLRKMWTDRGNVPTFSAGVAELRAGDTVQSLVERADTALYAAKRAGRNRIERASKLHSVPNTDGRVIDIADSKSDVTA